MKTSFLLFAGLLLCIGSKSEAQVTIGDFDHLFIGQNAVNLTAASLPPDTSVDYFDSLDLNSDGQYDVRFRLSATKTTGSQGGSSMIIALHPGFEFAGSGTGLVARLAAGDQVGPGNLWVSGTGTLVTKFNNAGVPAQSGNWSLQASGYVGYRIITPQDTFYGWMSMRAQVNTSVPSATLQVRSNWTIEPAVPIQYQHFVVAGDVGGLVPGSKTILLDQGPVPFGGTATKGDSLDLNNDGISDVYLSAWVCNGYDCTIGSTGLSGMHTGFNFIDGVEYARRFNQGDTIVSGGNWNLFASPYHTSAFVSKGGGFGGYQSQGEWKNMYTGYLGFRLVTPASDTLLGWMRVFTYSLETNGARLEVNAWAIEPDPAQKPVIQWTVVPDKAVYCAGDTITLQSLTQHAQSEWHFWDGATDTAQNVTLVLPDSTVSIYLKAVNPYGTASITQVLQISPLSLTASDLTLDCAQPMGTLFAETNIPAEIRWVIGNDTIHGLPFPPVNSPGPALVVAQDAYGCIVSEQIDILADFTAPDIALEYESGNQLLLAYSSTPGTVFQWISGTSPDPVYGDTVHVAVSGVYTLVATAPNGCTATEQITAVATPIREPWVGTISIQPIPANDFLRIENYTPDAFDYNIFDLNGQARLEAGTILANSVSRADIKSLPGGMYVLRGYSGKGALYSRIFVKL